jgi:hypothetical protein
VEQEFSGQTILVPPFSALALHRAAEPSQIHAEALALREEYQDFRRNMLELEHEWQWAKSINERLKITRRIQRLGHEVTRPFDQAGQMSFQSTLRYIPDAVDVASNPTSPVAWTKALLELPADALISWYMRRPVAKLTRAGRVVGKLAEYDTLVEKHFGEGPARRVLKLQRTGLIFLLD